MHFGASVHLPCVPGRDPPLWEGLGTNLRTSRAQNSLPMDNLQLGVQSGEKNLPGKGAPLLPTRPARPRGPTRSHCGDPRGLGQPPSAPRKPGSYDAPFPWRQDHTGPTLTGLMCPRAQAAWLVRSSVSGLMLFLNPRIRADWGGLSDGVQRERRREAPHARAGSHTQAPLPPPSPPRARSDRCARWVLCPPRRGCGWTRAPGGWRPGSCGKPVGPFL